MKNRVCILLFILLPTVAFFSGYLSSWEEVGVFSDAGDPYGKAPLQKMYNYEHTDVQLRLKEVPEYPWSVYVDSPDVLAMTQSAYVADDYIFNELGYHKWVFA